MLKTKTATIDESLSRRILERLGRTEGKVTVQSEEWDSGFCDTCSHLEEGFAVYVDNELVWPNDDLLNNFGGWVYADDRGTVIGKTLSTFGYFFEWLDGEDLEQLAIKEEEEEDN